MRRLLGMLRKRRSDAALAPQPGLADLDALVEHVRAAGLPVELSSRASRTRCRRASTSPPTGSCRRRSRTRSSTPARRARRCGPLRRPTRSSSRSPTTARGGNGGGAGHGLVGMRERAALYGGELEAGRGRRRLRRARTAARRGRSSRDPRPHRRRPGARARRLPHDPRRPEGHRGRRRGGATAARRSRRRASSRPTSC